MAENSEAKKMRRSSSKAPGSRDRAGGLHRDQARPVGAEEPLVVLDESAGFDPYDTASLYVGKTPDEPPEK